MRSPSMMVGFIEPVGTTFQSASEERTEKSAISMIAKGRICSRHILAHHALENFSGSGAAESGDSLGVEAEKIGFTGSADLSCVAFICANTSYRQKSCTFASLHRLSLGRRLGNAYSGQQHECQTRQQPEHLPEHKSGP